MRNGRASKQFGQSTVEFMLMVPVIFAIFFFVIEMSLYFTAVQYSQYAVFVTARALNADYRIKDDNLDAEGVARLVMTGSALWNNYSVNEANSSTGIIIKMDSWKTNFPYISALMPNAPFTVSAFLGPREVLYENRARSEVTSDGYENCFDNDMSFKKC